MNPIKIFFLFFLLFFFSLSGNAQTLINGDFEDNDVHECTYNLLNDEFNAVMPHVFAFGNNSEMDIHADDCGYALPPSNDWFVSLSQRPSGEVDQISLEIDMPLTAGEIYQLSFFDWAETSGLDNIPLPLEIGVSTDTFNFGELIYTSLPKDTEWTLRSVEFTAPSDGRFVTVRMAGDLLLKGWTFVDDFKLSPFTHTEEKNNPQVNIYPNPVRDWVNVESDFPIKSIRLFSAMGKTVENINTNNSFEQINLNNLSAGFYFLEIISDQGRVVEKIEKTGF